ncbi:20588_t:CDS:2, partial [Cetraspora pellucida]
MHCVYLCAKKHLAIEAYPNLIELTNLQAQNKTELVYNKPSITVAPPIFGPKKASLDTMSEFNQLSNYATYNNSKAGADFLHAIATVIEENILAEHIVKNMSVLRYLGLIELDETNAETIVNNLQKFFIAKMLDTQKLMHFGSNEINPFMTNCHCIAHRLNLVGKDSADEQHLKLFQSLDNEDPQLAILHVISTRWLSLSNAVSNLHQIIFSIKDALYNKALNDFCIKTRQRANTLYNDIDSEFILATKYLADILSIISDTIEYDELPSVFKEFAISFIKNLCQRFPNVENEIQLLELLKEWREVKLVLKNYKELDFVEGWKRIFDSSKFLILYPNITEI